MLGPSSARAAATLAFATTALALNITVPAHAGWNLYDQYKSYYAIPYVASPNFNSDNAYRQVNLSVNGSQDFTVMVDTGSQGVVVSAYNVPGYIPTNNTQTVQYSSDNVTGVGQWISATVSFPDSHNTLSGQIAQATLPIFVVQTAYSGTSVSDCTQAPSQSPSSGPRCMNYMGIGFGRPDTGWGPYLPSLANNALLNIDGMAEGTVRAGYILTQTGIDAGLTAQNTGPGYAYLKLMQEQIGGQIGTQWTTPNGTVQIINNGTEIANYSTQILMDTGINAIFGNTGATYETNGNYTFNIILIGGSAGYQFSAGGNAINSANGTGSVLCGGRFEQNDFAARKLRIYADFFRAQLSWRVRRTERRRSFACRV